MTEHSSQEKVATTTEVKKTSTDTATAAQHNHFTPLPSVGDLFTQAWHRFTGGVVNALLITLIGSLISGIFAAISIALFIGITASKVPVSQMQSIITENGFPALIAELGSSFGVAVGLSVGLLIIASLIVGTVMTCGMVYAFAWAENKPSLGDVISGGMRKILPFIAVSILVSLLTFGSFWVFFIPLIVLSIFLSFSYYEVLLEDKGPFEALKSSVAIISHNFGPLVGRWLLFTLGYLVFVLVLPATFNAMGDVVGAMYSFVNLFISYAVGWYSVAFGTTLYMHAKAATPKNVQSNGLFWGLASVSLVGWIIFLVMLSVILNVVGAKMDDWKKEFSSQGDTAAVSMDDTITPEKLDMIQTSCDIAIGKPTTYSEDDRFWIYEERETSADAFRGLAPAKQLAKGVQAGYLSFKSNEDRLSDRNAATFNIGFPGFRIYCLDNTAKLDLAGFVEQAKANKDYTVTLADSQRMAGDLMIQPVYVEGLTNGDYYKERYYLAVSPADDSKLLLLMGVGPENGDEMSEDILSDLFNIENSLTTELAPIPNM
jgi:hypothetical protein